MKINKGLFFSLKRSNRKITVAGAKVVKKTDARDCLPLIKGDKGATVADSVCWKQQT